MKRVAASIVDRLVDAYLHLRVGELHALLEEMGASHELTDACRALLDFAENGLSWGKARPIDAAFAKNIASPELLVCLLDVLSRHAHAVGDEGSMARLVDRMEGVLPRLSHWRLRCLVRRHQHWLSRLRGVVRKEVAFAKLGLADAETGTDLWYEFLVKSGESCVIAGDFDGAREVMSVLHDWEQVQRAEREYGIAVRETTFSYLMACGEPLEALEWVGNFRDVEMGYLRFSYGCLAAKALTMLGRHGEAGRILEEVRSAFDAAESLVGRLHRAEVRNRILAGYAFLALGEKRIDDCRLYLQMLRERNQNPDRDLREVAEVTVEFDLWCRNTAAAELALSREDPHGELWIWALARSRLALQKGDTAGATKHFRRLLDSAPPAHVEMCMAWCHELTPRDVCRLCLFASGGWPSKLARDKKAAQAPDVADVELIGESEGMCRVRMEVNRFASLPVGHPILLTGETGTGKDIAARQIHRCGARPTAPFVALNCAAIPDSLAEAELFGHTKGAFTGASDSACGLLHSAGEGTVFLDEINSMSTRVQGLLLRVLETGEYRPVGATKSRRTHARFVLASNEDLEVAVREKRFRADLYYRLARFCIFMPPLREHLEDIPMFCQYFTRLALGADRPRMSSQLMERFLAHQWPGNVRELRNEVERLVLLHGHLEEIPEHLSRIRVQGSVSVGMDGSVRSVGMPESRGVPVATAGAGAHVPGIPSARERRRRVLALFDRMPHLYRRDITELLGCSPATATQDLKALVKAGLIQRVITSGHLRTSYFVRNGVG